MNKTYARDLKRAIVIFVAKFSAITIALAVVIILLESAMATHKEKIETKKRDALAIQTSMSAYISLAKDYTQIEKKYNLLPENKRATFILDRKSVMDAIVSGGKQYGLTNFTIDDISETQLSSISGLDPISYDAKAFKVSITFNHALEQSVVDFMNDISQSDGFIVLHSIKTAKITDVANSSLQDLNLGKTKGFLKTSLTFYWIYIES